MDRTGDAVPIAELFEERRHLLDIAHWMLGSSREAESVIDETYQRWYELSGPARARIAKPRSWLAQVVGSICLARLAPPDPLMGDTPPEGHTVTVTSRPSGMVHGELLLGALDSLPPAGPADLALLSVRARSSRPVTRQEHDALARAFQRACLTEDAVLLASLLAPDATACFDGGGKVRSLIKPVHGNQQVAHSLLTLLARRRRVSLHTRSVNGRTGLVVRYDNQVVAVISLDTADHHVIQVWVILNPHKLRPWNQPGTTTVRRRQVTRWPERTGGDEAR